MAALRHDAITCRAILKLHAPSLAFECVWMRYDYVGVLIVRRDLVFTMYTAHIFLLSTCAWVCSAGAHALVASGVRRVRPRACAEHGLVACASCLRGGMMTSPAGRVEAEGRRELRWGVQRRQIRWAGRWCFIVIHGLANGVIHATQGWLHSWVATC